MTRDEIIQMAQEAELTIKPPSWGYTECYHFAGYEDIFCRFAELVAAREREACAKVCDEEMKYAETWGTGLQVITADKIATAIRARNNHG
jgi:hypothetical protein